MIAIFTFWTIYDYTVVFYLCQHVFACSEWAGFAAKDFGEVYVCFFPCGMLSFSAVWLRRSSWVSWWLVFQWYTFWSPSHWSSCLLSEKDKRCSLTGCLRRRPLCCMRMRHFLLTFLRYAKLFYRLSSFLCLMKK